MLVDAVESWNLNSYGRNSAYTISIFAAEQDPHDDVPDIIISQRLNEKCLAEDIETILKKRVEELKHSSLRVRESLLMDGMKNIQTKNKDHHQFMASQRKKISSFRSKDAFGRGDYEGGDTTSASEMHFNPSAMINMQYYD